MRIVEVKVKTAQSDPPDCWPISQRFEVGANQHSMAMGGLSGPPLDVKRIGSVLIFTDCPALALVIEEAVQGFGRRMATVEFE